MTTTIKLPTYYTIAKSSNVLTTMNNKAFIINYINEKSMKVKNLIIDDIKNIDNQDIKSKLESILNVSIMIKKSKLDKKLDINALYIKNIVSIIKKFESIDRKIVNKIIKDMNNEYNPTMTKKYNLDIMKLINKLLKKYEVVTSATTATTDTKSDDTKSDDTKSDDTKSDDKKESSYDEILTMALNLDDDKKLELIASLQESMNLAIAV